MQTLVLAILFAVTFRATAYIAGFDIGGEFSKIAIVVPKRAPEVILNLHSKRKTPTAFSFVDETRAFGDAALQQLAGAAPSVARFFPQFLGQKVDDLSAPTARGLPTTFFPLRLSSDHERWAYHFNVGDLDLSVEEVAANFLAFGKKIATAAADKKKLASAMITVPASSTLRQRQAMLHAAEIAGIPQPRLIHEVSAAAVHRALDIKAESPSDTSSDDEDLEPKEGDTPADKLRKIQAKRAKKKQTKSAPKSFRTNVLFFNMGSRHTEACIARFHIEPTQTSVTMKGCGSSDKLGGHFLDLVIAQKMFEKAASEHESGSLEQNAKAVQMILTQAAKTKLLLSTNKEASFVIESLHNNKDFIAKITKVEFEKWCEEFFPLVGEVVDKAMNKSNVKFENVEGVEVIGGGWRVPWVQQVLSDYLVEKRGEDLKPLALGQHLNGEEAAAMGASYYAATTAGGFGSRFRPVPLNDVSLHEYSLSVQKLNSTQPGKDFSAEPQVIFKYGAKLGDPQKKLELKGLPYDMRLTLFEDGNPVESHRVTGLFSAAKVKYPKAKAPDVLIPIELDSSGVVSIGQVEAIFEALGEPKADPKTKMTIAPKMEKKKVGLLHNVEYERPVPMSRRERLTASKRFKDMAEADKAVSQVAAARNSLESYIYDCKDKLTSPEVTAVSSEERLAELQSLLDEALSWLQENTDGKAQKYMARLNALKRDVDPVLKDAKEQSAREERANMERDGTAGTESAKAKAARIAKKNEAKSKRKEKGEL